MKKKTKPKRL